MYIFNLICKLMNRKVLLKVNRIKKVVQIEQLPLI